MQLPSHINGSMAGCDANVRGARDLPNLGTETKGPCAYDRARPLISFTYTALLRAHSEGGRKRIGGPSRDRAVSFAPPIVFAG